MNCFLKKGLFMIDIFTLSVDISQKIFTCLSKCFLFFWPSETGKVLLISYDISKKKQYTLICSWTDRSVNINPADDYNCSLLLEEETFLSKHHVKGYLNKRWPAEKSPTSQSCVMNGVMCNEQNGFSSLPPWSCIA